MVQFLSLLWELLKDMSIVNTPKFKLGQSGMHVPKYLGVQR